MSVSEPVKTVLILLWLLVFNFLPATIKRFKLYGKQRVISLQGLSHSFVAIAYGLSSS